MGNNFKYVCIYFKMIIKLVLVHTNTIHENSYHFLKIACLVRRVTTLYNFLNLANVWLPRQLASHICFYFDLRRCPTSCRLRTTLLNKCERKTSLTLDSLIESQEPGGPRTTLWEPRFWQPGTDEISQPRIPIHLGGNQQLAEEEWDRTLEKTG